ncbi:MAG TPA: hypothetical protein ENJ42_02565, partial [Hellea balneolensis]|nr:hypothetical protein [Hellea balneolensis]
MLCLHGIYQKGAEMFQNGRNFTQFLGGFERNFYRVLLIILTTFTILLALNASAAIPDTKIRPNPTYILKSSLNQFSGTELATLSPSSPVYNLKFDLPAHDWYENLEVFLSAYPEGPVDKNSSIFVSYNGSSPIPLRAQGSRFDAHIRLDPSRIRSQGNVLKFFITGKTATACTPGENAHWVLDLENSKLTSRARAKQRSVQISDIKTRLANPMTAPKTVRIVAHGPNKTALRALSAQGVALRTPNLPAFVIDKSRADFEIVFARFDELPQLATSLPPIAP